jgi:hypothetical protein
MIVAVIDAGHCSCRMVEVAVATEEEAVMLERRDFEVLE